MYSGPSQFENIVKHAGDVAAAIVLAALALANLRRRRLSDSSIRLLIFWPAAAVVVCSALLALVHWGQPEWTVHIAIRCAGLCGVLVLAIRRCRRDGSKRSFRATDECG